MDHSPKRPKAYSYLRMSTDVQLKGDSRRRQLEASRQWAVEHGLDLIEERQLEDIGISAFRGANVTQGALGAFLTAVREQKVEEGSYLLVESLDRLSRQEVMKSFAMLTQLVTSGVRVVTISDGREYNGNTELDGLLWSLVVLSRANEESAMKSKRLAAAWANKRRSAADTKLTAICPKWLKFDGSTKEFQVDEAKAEVVQGIFHDSAAGMGAFTIARRLNDKKVPTFGKSRDWQTSYVAKILANRSVIGEYQPHKMLKGKRTPDGTPIKNYFPAVISEALFYEAQHARQNRRAEGGGRKGPFLSNLFSKKMLICACCGGAMHFINKGYGPKGGQYLVCDRANRNVDCDRTRWRYRPFEASVLAFLSELDLEAVLTDRSSTSQLEQARSQVAALGGKIVELQKARDAAFDLLTTVSASKNYVAARLDDLEQQIDVAEKELTEARNKEAVYESRRAGARDNSIDVKTLIEAIQVRGDDVLALRSRLASRMREVVHRILVAPRGGAPIEERLRKAIGEPPNRHPDERPYFTIEFMSAASRTIYPAAHDPFSFEVMMDRPVRAPHVTTYKDGRRESSDITDIVEVYLTNDDGEDLRTLMSAEDAERRFPEAKRRVLTWDDLWTDPDELDDTE